MCEGSAGVKNGSVGQSKGKRRLIQYRLINDGRRLLRLNDIGGVRPVYCVGGSGVVGSFTWQTFTAPLLSY